jgi:hypothetical protein
VLTNTVPPLEFFVATPGQSRKKVCSTTPWNYSRSTPQEFLPRKRDWRNASLIVPFEVIGDGYVERTFVLFRRRAYATACFKRYLLLLALISGY